MPQNNDEPMPSSGELEVQDSAIYLFMHTFYAQCRKGWQKYKSKLKTFNGRNAESDAIQELCDATAYLRQLAMELEQASKDIEYLLHFYDNCDTTSVTPEIATIKLRWEKFRESHS